MVAPVLLIEDDPDIREDLGFLLRARGYEVETASDGAEALMIIERVRPSVILLDLRMPVLDGWKFRAEAHKKPALAGVPIILLTGVEDAESVAREMGAVDVVSKPIDLAKFFRLVDRHGLRTKA